VNSDSISVIHISIAIIIYTILVFHVIFALMQGIIFIFDYWLK